MHIVTIKELYFYRPKNFNKYNISLFIQNTDIFYIILYCYVVKTHYKIMQYYYFLFNSIILKLLMQSISFYAVDYLEDCVPWIRLYNMFCIILSAQPKYLAMLL